MTEPAKAVKDFLRSYPSETRHLALEVRKLVRHCIPKIEERVDPSAKVIGYRFGPGYKGLICTIIPSKSGVKLGFFRGAELPDPERLLAGDGKVHRHFQVRTAADLKKAGLKPLLKSALAAWKRRAATAVKS